MSNRQRVMLKLIGLSNEEFAGLLSRMLPDLMGADLPAPFPELCADGGDETLRALAAWLGENAR